MGSIDEVKFQIDSCERARTMLIRHWLSSGIGPVLERRSEARIDGAECAGVQDWVLGGSS